MDPRLTAVSAMLVVALPLVAGVQFTIGATLAGSASILLAVTELACPRPRRTVIVMSVILFVAGLPYRPMGGAAGALITGGVLVPWFVWRTRADAARTAYLAATLVLVVVLSAGLNYVDGLMYRTDQAWNAYHQHNWMAAELVDGEAICRRTTWLPFAQQRAGPATIGRCCSAGLPSTRLFTGSSRYLTRTRHARQPCRGTSGSHGLHGRQPTAAATRFGTWPSILWRR